MMIFDYVIIALLAAIAGGLWMPRRKHGDKEEHREIAREVREVEQEVAQVEQLEVVELVAFKEVFDRLGKIDFKLGCLTDEIRHLIHALHPRVRGFQITQGDHMPVTGVKVGGSGHFVAAPQPAGALLPAGNIPAWSVSDPSVGFSPSPDGLEVDASVPAGSTLTSFDLTITAQPLADGSSPTATVTVPVISASAQVTGFDISQTS